MIFEDLDVGLRGDGREQSALDFAAGDIFGVQNAAFGMAAFLAEVQFPARRCACGTSRSENFMPSSINSAMRAGPSSTMVRTTASLQSPAPASSVSRTCISKESSLLVTAAMPPCA